MLLPVDNIIQLNSGVSNNFSAFVKIRSVDSAGRSALHKGFNLELFLSLDRHYDSSDIQIFRAFCAGDSCDGVNTFNIQCDFGYLSTEKIKMQFYCDTNNANGLGYIDNRFLNVLPKRAFVLLKVSGNNPTSKSNYNIYPKEVDIN